MKIKFKPTLKGFLFYLLFGIVAFVLSGIISVFWLKIVAFFMGVPRLGFDSQPAIAKVLHSILSYSPWIVLGVILVIDVIKVRLDRFLSFFAGLAVVYLSLIFFMIGGPILADYLNRRGFSSDDWKNEISDRKNPVRLRMVDDLLDKYSLVGMSKSEIDTLLGVAGPSYYFKEYDYVYWLGPERRFISLDSEWLVLKFENDTTIEARIVRD